VFSLGGFMTIDGQELITNLSRATARFGRSSSVEPGPGMKGWDERIYCVPSEEFKFNKLIRDGGAGKSR
jgi:hypothetical protein